MYSKLIYVNEMRLNATQVKSGVRESWGVLAIFR